MSSPSPHWTAEITHRGIGPRHDNWYRLTCTWRPSAGDIKHAQIKLGFDPRGYGGPDILVRGKTPDGRHWVTWCSAASAD